MSDEPIATKLTALRPSAARLELALHSACPTRAEEKLTTPAAINACADNYHALRRETADLLEAVVELRRSIEARWDVTVPDPRRCTEL